MIGTLENVIKVCLHYDKLYWVDKLLNNDSNE